MRRLNTFFLVFLLLLGISISFSQKVVTIRFATWDTGELYKIEQEIAKRFEREYPNIKVQVESYGDSFDQKLAASFGAKNPPDVMYMWDFPTYYESLIPLDDLLKQDKSINLNDYYPALFNYCKYEGKLYGLPVGFTSHVIYYNKDLFKTQKITTPSTNWTWDEFIEKARKLTNPSQKIYGFAFPVSPDPYDFEQFLWSNGGSYCSPDGKEINGYLNSREMVEVLSLFTKMLKEKIAVLTGTQQIQSGGDLFKAGKLGMLESGIWRLPEFIEAKLNFGVHILPAFKGKPVKSILNVSAISIAKDTKNLKEAWEFVKYYSYNKEAIKMRKGDLPTRKTVVAELKLNSNPYYKPFYKMIEVSADKIPSFYLNKNMRRIYDELAITIEQIFSEQANEEKIKEYLDNLVNRTKDWLKD
ncbi:ABC transporter substrate-binding protein [Dictyoglomus thermophilum]|uniref:Sugar uptake ABC transporter periplasmic solute-binding protein n=1 Tax=Dictyoglomus thermophilum (strain ATCC 35947 / DSM 3960 / H-6-12) TaxID=309799 RepID=B5YBF7_DICT6|nr:sugar ABC transporter substrate-binding protein [Dictyoglomus thermophilum]ACI18773.1 putative sugar uptake ABC transporter periplasmic solute-binding protein [Dictyoglomus thermophilum H-6-12]